MKPLSEMLEMIDRAVDSISPEDLARKLMSYGMEFDNPPSPVMQISIPGANLEDVKICDEELFTETVIVFAHAETRKVSKVALTSQAEVPNLSNNELALAA